MSKVQYLLKIIFAYFSKNFPDFLSGTKILCMRIPDFTSSIEIGVLHAQLFHTWLKIRKIIRPKGKEFCGASSSSWGSLSLGHSALEKLERFWHYHVSINTLCWKSKRASLIPLTGKSLRWGEEGQSFLNKKETL